MDYHGECQLRSRTSASVPPTATPSSSTATGGTFFEFVRLAGGPLFATIGDVSRYGLTAPVIASGVRSFIRRAVQDERREELTGVIQDLNSTMWGLSPDAYGTLLCARFDAFERRLTYINAGHEPALLIRRTGRIRRLDGAGAVLGLSLQSVWRERALTLEAGDVLVAFSEGVSESLDAGDGQLRDSGLLEVLRFHRDAPAGDLVRSFLEAVDHFDRTGRRNDHTMIAVRYLDQASANVPERSVEMALSAA